MAELSDPKVSELLSKPNHAVLSTLNADGSIHSAIVWISVEDGKVALNSARGRVWPSNLERDPRATLTLLNEGNPYEYVEIKGAVTATTEGADEHIDALAQKYIGQERYPWRQPGEQRLKLLLDPARVRYVSAG